MKASIHFELETVEDFALFGRVFAAAGGFGKEGVVVAPAPEQEKQIEAKAAEKAKPAPKAKAKVEEPKVEEKPVEEPKAEAKVETVEAETVDKPLVAKELRAFIAKKGDTGAKEAMAVLREFGAGKFDELKPEDYSKFLSALAKA